MTHYLLALDQGTTSSRAIVFDDAGHIVASAAQAFEQKFPQPGWVEHDAKDIWITQLACVRQALAQANITADQVAALGITNQRETTVIWDRASGEPIAPAIVWQDRRTAAVCDQLRAEGVQAEVTQKTGLLLDPYFSATKIAWLLDHVPGARTRAHRGDLAFGTIDSWLIWHLTNGAAHVTDVSNASRTSLFNLNTLDWDDDLLALFRVPRALLPKVVASSGVVGVTALELLGHSVPIAGVAGDQQAATFGQACFGAGMAKNTYGTGCFMLMNTGAAPRVSNHRLLTTLGWQRASGDTAYMLEGSVFMGGALVQWLRDGLGLIQNAADIETLAASCTDTGGLSLVPAFTGLGAPHWDAHARGVLIGMTRGTSKAHIARAALEAIAHQCADVLEAMHQDAGHALTELRVDGGGACNDMLMQLQADLIGVPVVRPKVTETTALGAAYLAGLAVHVWSNKAQISKLWQVDRRFEPAMPEATRAQMRAQWARAVERSKGWVNV